MSITRTIRVNVELIRYGRSGGLYVASIPGTGLLTNPTGTPLFSIAKVMLANNYDPQWRVEKYNFDKRTGEYQLSLVTTIGAAAKVRTTERKSASGFQRAGSKANK